MTDEPRQTTPRPILNSIESQLFVANMKSSCDFYTNKLGFAVAFVYDDPPFYGQITRDNVRINLRLVCRRIMLGSLAAFIFLTLVTATARSASANQSARCTVAPPRQLIDNAGQS